MASKRDERPDKSKHVQPGDVRRPGESNGDSGSDRPECWSFTLVRQEPAAQELHEAETVSGVPKNGRLQVLSDSRGPLGYAHQASAKNIIGRIQQTGAKALKGTVIETGAKIRVRLCLLA